MAHIGKRSAGVSDLANGKVTDHTATEIGKAILSVGKHDGAAIILFGICVLSLIFVGESAGWTYMAVLAFAGLVFYGLYTRHKIETAKLELRREQLNLEKGAVGARQLRLPEPDRKPASGDVR